jgi:hypothetical protein
MVDIELLQHKFNIRIKKKHEMKGKRQDIAVAIIPRSVEAQLNGKIITSIHTKRHRKGRIHGQVL